MFVLGWLKSNRRRKFEIGSTDGLVYILMHKQVIKLDATRCEQVIAALQQALEHIKREGKE